MISRYGSATVIAVAALVLATLLFGSSVVDALRVNDEPVAVTTSAPSVSTGPAESPDVATAGQPTEAPVGEAWLAQASTSSVTNTQLHQAVQQDLFQPNRTAPAQRYRLPNQVVVRQPSEAERPRFPMFRIVGAATLEDGGLALVQAEGSAPVTVGMGESINGYTLEAVHAESVTMVGEAGRVDLPIQAAEVAQASGGSNGRDARSRAQTAAQQAATLQQRVQQLLQGRAGAQGRGGFGGRGGRGSRGGRGGRGGGGS